eukprot:gene36250-43974_t
MSSDQYIIDEFRKAGGNLDKGESEIRGIVKETAVADRVLEMKKDRKQLLDGGYRDYLSHPDDLKDLPFLEETEKTRLTAKLRKMGENDERSRKEAQETFSDIKSRLGTDGSSSGKSGGQLPPLPQSSSGGAWPPSSPHNASGGTQAAPIDISKVNGSNVRTVLGNCELFRGRRALDYDYAALSPLLELTSDSSAKGLLIAAQQSQDFQVEMSMEDTFTSSVKFSSTTVAASAKVHSVWGVGAESSYDHSWSNEKVRRESNSTYKYCAKYFSPCCYFNLRAAIEKGAVCLNEIALRKLKELINIEYVSSEHVKEFIECFGEVVPYVVTIGVSAIAEGKKTGITISDLNQSKSAIKAAAAASVQAYGVGGAAGMGVGKEGASGKQSDTNSTTEKLSWTATGGNALNGQNPCTIANHRNDFNSWRIIDYREFRPTIEVIAELSGEEGLLNQCRLALGHLFPFKHKFASRGYTYVGKFQQRSDPPVPCGLGTKYFDSGAICEGVWPTGKGTVLFNEVRYYVEWIHGGIDVAKHGNLVSVLGSRVPFHVSLSGGDYCVGEAKRSTNAFFVLHGKMKMVTGGFTYLHGKGVYTGAGGDMYEGDWEEGKKHGKGVYAWADGSKYEGDWKDDNRNGKGKITCANCNYYEGDWKDDKKRGKGVYTWADGSKYEGEWKDDNINGKGKITCANGNNYEGDWEEGKKHGKGVYAWADGSKYDGEWKDDTRNGTGVFTTIDGDKYEGGWKDDKQHGKGVYSWANNDKYEGDWKDGKRSGKGVHTWASGNKYEGGWKNDKKHGRGVFTSLDGNKYDGDWKDDKQNGKGVYSWANNDKYDGEYKDGKRNGRGVFTSADGNKYEGDFKDGKKHGKGMLLLADGRKYEGDFKDDMKHGEGIITSANGSKYAGDWKDDKRNGRGVFTWANGDKYVGDWKDDKRNGRGVFTW